MSEKNLLLNVSEKLSAAVPTPTQTQPKVTLKVMKCPTCGANLKAENASDAIACVYCGNVIVPVNEAPSAPATSEASSLDISGVIKVEGIKTSSSALAYIEMFFDEYDWDSFAYAHTLSVWSIDKLVTSLRSNSADDKNTWFACFSSIYVPLKKKIEGCKTILNDVIARYKADDLDSYSKFDAYKRISSMIKENRDELIEKLEKYIANAKKFGATEEELDSYKSHVKEIKDIVNIVVYNDVKSIPAVRTFIEEKNSRIARELSEIGINAENEYNRAKIYIKEKRYVDALNVLISLRGYSDSAEIINKIDKYYLIYDILEIEGTLYFFKKEGEDGQSLNLYPTANGRIFHTPIIKNIGQIITNHADILYFLDGAGILKKFNLSDKKEEKLHKKPFSKKSIFVYNKRVFLVTGGGEDGGKHTIVELNLATGKVDTFLDNISKVISLNNNKMIYNVVEKSVDKKTKQETTKVLTSIVNVDTMETVKLGTKNLSIEGFTEDSVVYTQHAPNKFNKNLYMKSFDSSMPEVLVEPNIYEFSKIIGGKLFYYIGHAGNRSLININYDGSERTQWPLFIHKLLFEQGGWIYFIRKAGYNAVLCKARLDGSEFKIIAADVDEFVNFKNGYLYYLNDDSALIKVRMDGSNLQELCDDVEKVLAVTENKIIFVSIDGRQQITNENGLPVYKTVKSIYAVEFNGSGKIKLAYDIKSAEKYDDNTVYFVGAEEITSSYDKLEEHCEVLYRLDVATNGIEKLLYLEMEPKKKTFWFLIAIAVMAICFILAFFGIGEGDEGLTTFGFIGGFVSLVAAIVIRFIEKKKGA